MRRTRNVRSVRSLFSLLLAMTVYAVRPGIAAADGVTVSYSFVSSKVTFHEPVFLQFQAKNDSAQPIQLDLGKDRTENFVVSFAGPEGAEGRLLQLRRNGIGTIGRLSLRPGEAYARKLLLNQWIEFKTPGRYQIEVHLAEPVQNMAGVPVAETGSFRGTVEVLPEDPTRLTNVCASLAEQVEAASSYEEALDVALPLSYIQDPIAVLYLEKVLFAGRLVDNIAINGLEKIADEEAVRVLISALGVTEPPFTAIAARAALGRIEEKTLDPARKEAIRRALEHADGKKP